MYYSLINYDECSIPYSELILLIINQLKIKVESINISRIELKDLMITIHVFEMNVHYFMYIIGYNFLFLCTIVLQNR